MRRDVAILACAISAGIHAALVPMHGVSFVAAAGLLAVAAAWLTLRPASTLALVSSACVLASVLGAYALAVGLGEPLDALALTTKAIEATGLVAALTLLKGALRWTRHVRFLSA